VGGEKVYPQEVENVILDMDEVSEATVYGEKNPIIGNIVCVKVKIKNKEEEKIFTSKLKRHCKENLQGYKVPVKVALVQNISHSDRFKKTRQFNE
jgi:acyl-CoA synthetase (AMP-forming)/AMP-acid ligase II